MSAPAGIDYAALANQARQSAPGGNSGAVDYAALADQVRGGGATPKPPPPVSGPTPTEKGLQGEGIWESAWNALKGPFLALGQYASEQKQISQGKQPFQMALDKYNQLRASGAPDDQVKAAEAEATAASSSASRMMAERPASKWLMP